MEFGSMLDYPDGSMWDPYSNASSGRQFTRNAHAVDDTRVDWRETLEAHIFKADMPGLKKEEVRVQVLEDGRTLEISGERTKEDAQEGDTWHQVERSTGNFSRRFRIPENSDMNQVHAKVQDGVLTVEIPKVKRPKPQVRRIEIS